MRFFLVAILAFVLTSFGLSPATALTLKPFKDALFAYPAIFFRVTTRHEFKQSVDALFSR